MTGDHPYQATIDALREHAPAGVELAIVLGSGLSNAADMLRKAVHVPTSKLADYPQAGVPGHAGMISLGAVGRLGLVVYRGRTHYYERGSISEILAPIHVAHGLGARFVILTNAAGGIRRSFAPGDLMLIEDQLNFTFRTLSHSSPGMPSRLPLLYDPILVQLAHNVAQRLGIALQQGVYAGVLGPSYESAAEIGMLARAGADAVGMSTVLEASEARRRGMRVLGISLITNRATGTGGGPAQHDEVTMVGEQAAIRVGKLLRGLAEALRG